jgi:hypothetical protein
MIEAEFYCLADKIEQAMVCQIYCAVNVSLVSCSCEDISY